MLQSKFLNLRLEHLCFKPEIDLFANDVNRKFGKCAAFRPDPGAMHIDASSIDPFYSSHINSSFKSERKQCREYYSSPIWANSCLVQGHAIITLSQNDQN